MRVLCGKAVVGGGGGGLDRGRRRCIAIASECTVCRGRGWRGVRERLVAATVTVLLEVERGKCERDANT